MKFKPEGYVCKVEGCGRQFATPSKLGYHTVAEHRSPEVADWAVAQRKKWQQDGELCPWRCGERFYSPTTMKTHIFMVHKAQVDEAIAKVNRQ